MRRAENQSLGACSGGALAEPNGYTVASYERCAADYARATEPGTNGVERQALGNLLRVARNQGWILEIGSGPGWDADWLDHAGLKVRRTDAAAAFVALQKARGVKAEVLDVVKDELGGPYAGLSRSTYSSTSTVRNCRLSWQRFPSRSPIGAHSCSRFGRAAAISSRRVKAAATTTLPCGSGPTWWQCSNHSDFGRSGRAPKKIGRTLVDDPGDQGRRR